MKAGRKRSHETVVGAIPEARYVLINRLVMPLMAFILLVIIARRSDTLLGEYALVTTFYYIMQTLPLLGLTPYLMREVARNNSLAGKYFVNIGLIAVAACVIIYLAANALVDSGPYSADVRSSVRVVGYTVVPGILAFILESILISVRNARYVAVIATVENISRLAISVVVLAAGGGVIELMWVLLGTRVFAFMMYFLVASRMEFFKMTLPDISVMRKLARVLPVFAMNSLLFVVVARIDYVALSIWESVDRIGYYAIAYRLPEILMIVISAGITTFYSPLARSYHRSKRHFIRQAKGLYVTSIVLFLLMAQIAVSFADDYVRLLFNRQYPDAVLYTRLLVSLVFILGLDQLSSSFLQAMDRQKSDVKSILAGSVIYVALLFTLIPEMHVMGAIYATLIAFSLQVIFKQYLLYKYIGPMLRPWKAAIITVLAVSYVLVWHAIEVPGVLYDDILFVIILLTSFPLLLSLFGVFRISRALRALWRVKSPRPASTFRGMIDHIVLDLKRHDQVLAKISRESSGVPVNTGLPAVILYRVYRFMYLKNWRIMPRVLWQSSITLFKTDIPPSSDIGPGLVLMSGTCTVIVGKVGKNVTFGPSAGCGASGTRDVGAGTGMPLIGDFVTLGSYAAILGGIHIQDRMVVPEYSQIYSEKRKRMILDSGAGL